MGLFNLGFDRAGPGVSKNGPQKKPFFLFWELYARKFFQLIAANLLYVLVSLPVFTQGLAQAGLTHVTRNYAREKHVFLPSDFFDTIRKNWKQALGAGLIELLIGAILTISTWFYATNFFLAKTDGILEFLFFALDICLLLVFFFWRYYLYFQIITFKMTLKQVIKNSFLFTFIGLKRNLLIAGILLLCYAVAFVFLWFCGSLYFGFAVLLMIYVFLFPAFRSFLIEFTIFPVVKRVIIDPYYEAHPEEDVEERKNLNLEVNATDKEQSVFRDDEVIVETSKAENTDGVPKQYSAAELHRGKRLSMSTADDEDDDTI